MTESLDTHVSEARLARASIEWLDRARKLEPMIQRYRDEAEQSRRMPRPLFEALRDAGFFRLWVPRRFGGPEVDMATLILVVEELSRVEGATGWNVMIGAEGSAIAAYLPEETARAMIAPRHAVVAGSFQPKGDATPVEGGYRVSGLWPLASGCAHATVVAAACRIIERGRPRPGPDGTPDLRVVLIPASQCAVLDTWYSAGLRGTGSSDVRVEDAFIPENQSFSLTRGLASEPGSLYGGATIQLLFALPVAAVGLGIARAAVDAFTEMAVGKVRLGATSALGEDGLVQATLGRAEAQLAAARAFVLAVADQMTQATGSEGRISHETTPLVPLAAAQASEMAAEVVTMLFRAAGSSGIYASSRLERCFRDVHMVTQHRSTNVFNFETAGRQLLVAAGRRHASLAEVQAGRPG